MHKKHHNITISIIFGFILYIIAYKPVFAQEYSLGVYPPLLELMVKPGKTITQVYKVYNGGSADVLLTSRVVPFRPADEFGNVALEESSPAQGWFSFLNADLALGDKFLVKAGKNQEVVLRIKVPDDTREEDFYFTLLFESQPLPSIGQSSSQNAIRIGSNVLITVSESGLLDKQFEVVQFSIGRHKFIDSFDQPKFVLRLRNNNKHLVTSEGQIDVTGLGYTNKFTLLPQNILANSVREISCFSEEKVVPCQMKPKFLLGKYQARLSINDETITFIALPFKLVVGGLTTMLLVLMMKFRLKI